MVKLTGRKWVAVVIAVVVVVIGLGWLLRPNSLPVGHQGEEGALDSRTLVADAGRSVWALEGGDVEVGVDIEGSIPGLDYEGFEVVSLIPLPVGTGELVWNAEHDEEGTLVSGRGMWRGYQVDVDWTFVSGNPQSRVRVVVRDVLVRELLEGDIVGNVALGRPVQRFFDGKSRFWGAGGVGGAGGVVWAQWEDETRALTLSRVSANDVAWDVSSGGGGEALDVAFWRRSELDAAVFGCDAMAEKTVDLMVQLDWTVGKSVPMTAAVLPHGYRAALVPVFGDLQSSGRGEFQNGAARSVEDWLSRARTLIYGHSSVEDPRYGNGGLLGAHFGGSVVVPGAWRDDDDVQALAAELEGTRVELISDGRTAYLAGNSVCEQAFRAVESGASVLVVPGLEGVDVQSSAGGVGSLRGLPEVMRVMALDGQRSSLVEGVFSQDSLENLLAEQGVLAISTPLVATRNPLIGLWHEALLAAERGGEWTLQSDVSRAFARGELLRETEQLLIASASGVQDYWRARAQVDIWQGMEGEIVVYNGGAGAVEGFTFVIAGMVRQVGDAVLEGVEIKHHGGLSYVSLDLDAGARREISLGGLDTEQLVGASLKGVAWEVEGGRE